jgi:hypothetical protein
LLYPLFLLLLLHALYSRLYFHVPTQDDPIQSTLSGSNSTRKYDRIAVRALYIYYILLYIPYCIVQIYGIGKGRNKEARRSGTNPFHTPDRINKHDPRENVIFS